MKRRIQCIALALTLGLLSGCGGTRLPFGLGNSAASAAESESAPLATEVLTPLLPDVAPVMLWGRSQLTRHAKTAYDTLSQAVACRQETPVEVDVREEEIDLVLEALRIDHPEYFWFDGEASFVTTELSRDAVKTECVLTYTLEPDEIRRQLQQVRQYTADCLSSPELQQAETDYEKIMGIYRYIIENTDYVVTEEDQSLLSVMVSHRGTCAGYSRSFQYLTSQLGVACTLALGTGTAGEAHGWNVVMCEGQWYQMDVTWGDPVTADGNPGDSLQYTYCMVPDTEIYRDHKLTGKLPMPVCTDTQWNYFVQEGRLFERWEEDAYERALSRAAERGERWFSVRFSSAGAYEKAREALLGDSLLMDMLIRCGLQNETGTRSVTYTTNDLFLEFSVALR